MNSHPTSRSHAQPTAFPASAPARPSDDEPAPATPDAVAPDDAALLEAARAGCPDAVAALWRRNWHPALAFARYFAPREDAEDLVSEAMSRVLGAISRGHGPSDHFSGYLKAAIRNLAVTRHARRFEVAVDSEVLSVFAPSAPAADKTAGDRDLIRDVRATIASLPPRYRTALVLNELEDLRTKEWAAQLGITEGAAHALAARARQAFRKAWLQRHSAPDEYVTAA